MQDNKKRIILKQSVKEAIHKQNKDKTEDILD